MKPASAKLNLVKNGIDLGIVTRDAAAMLGFYRDLLGLELEATLPMPGGGGTMHRLRAGESIIKIIQLEPQPADDAVPGGIRKATGYRYCTFAVNNLAACTASCEAAGHTVVVPTKQVREGVTISIIADPDGNWVELQQID